MNYKELICFEVHFVRLYGIDGSASTEGPSPNEPIRRRIAAVPPVSLLKRGNASLIAYRHGDNGVSQVIFYDFVGG